MYKSYVAVAPKPDEFPRLLDAMGESMRQTYDWSADVAKLKMPVMLVFGDGDMVRPEHEIKFYQLLGGGLKDAGWNRESMPQQPPGDPAGPDPLRYLRVAPAGGDGAAVPRRPERRAELGRGGEGAGAEQVIDKEDVMLAGKEMVATIAVKDLATARKFYEGTLGLKVEDDKGTEAHTYRSAGTRLIVYRSQFAGTNQATALNFMVGGEIDNLAKALRERGVTFEHYDMPGMKWEGDVMVGGPDEGRVVQGPRRQHPLHDERMTRRRGVSAAASSFVPSSRRSISARQRPQVTRLRRVVDSPEPASFPHSEIAPGCLRAWTASRCSTSSPPRSLRGCCSGMGLIMRSVGRRDQAR